MVSKKELKREQKKGMTKPMADGHLVTCFFLYPKHPFCLSWESQPFKVSSLLSFIGDFLVPI